MTRIIRWAGRVARKWYIYIYTRGVSGK